MSDKLSFIVFYVAFMSVYVAILTGFGMSGTSDLGALPTCAGILCIGDYFGWLFGLSFTVPAIGLINLVFIVPMTIGFFVMIAELIAEAIP